MVKISESLLREYADFIKQDYINWWTAGGKRPLTDTQMQMVAEFTVDFEPGSSYIRVVQGSGVSSRSSHSFIVVKPSDKFKVGDILKSASWKSPAKNFVRGNVIDKNFERVRWSGAI